MRGLGLTLLAMMAFPLSGCVEDGIGYTMSGTFREDATQQQVEDFQSTAHRFGVDVYIQESFPMQFVASGMDDDSCHDFRLELQAKDYLAQFTECQELEVGYK